MEVIMRISDYEARFKEVAGGFLFQAPSPWLFTPGEHYLVSEAQRAEILELGRDYHPMVRVVVLVLLFIGCPVGAVYLVSLFIPNADSNILTLVAGIILAFVFLIASALIFFHLRYHRLRPILSSLQRSDQTLTLEERLATRKKLSSARRAKRMNIERGIDSPRD
jgi:uncharacterized membrane protein